MTQIFSPAADTWIRLFLVSAVAAVAASLILFSGYARSDWITGANIHPGAQPVLFSHRHHAGELRIDCRYCHASVETSAFAGMPATQTCLSCHSQIFTTTAMLQPVVASAASGQPIAWTRVTRLPDHVYFNHSIHIAKGVGCTSCH